MNISDKYAETVLDALAERLRDLSTDIYLKDAEIERLRARNAELERIIKELRDV